MLYTKVQLPSRITLSHDVQAIFAECKGKVIDYFQVCLRSHLHLNVLVLTTTFIQQVPGKIHICVDGWTSPNVISCLGVTAHWHEDGKVKHIILDFIK